MGGGLGNTVVSNSPKVTIMPVMKEIISPLLMKAALRHMYLSAIHSGCSNACLLLRPLQASQRKRVKIEWIEWITIVYAKFIL
jgi:hypothetical protein